MYSKRCQRELNYPHSARRTFFQGNLFDENAEQEYNTIAARVMAKHKVPVVDLHGHVMAQFKPDEKHPAYTQYAQELEKRGQPLVSVLSKLAREVR